MQRALAVFTFLFVSVAAFGADVVTIKLPEGQMRCEVLGMTKSEISLKQSNGKTINVPHAVLTPKEVLACYKALDEKTKDANLRFDMGSYFLKKQLNAEAKEELAQALKLDAKLAAKVEPLLKQLEEAAKPPVVAAPKVEEKEKVPEKEKEPASKPPEPDEDGMVPVEVKPGEKLEDAIKRTMDDFAKNFKKQNVPPRGDKEMKEFLDKRLEELNSKIGGKWRLIETKHFYSFSNLPEPKHKQISLEWLEAPSNADGSQGIYPLLCTVLRHKEGDKLWNNKCPIYFFDTYRQFQEFAAVIDRSPGAGNSGGYFSARGREVHICIPFMKERLGGEKAADRAARSTLYHEGTHAFLQLTGEDVPLTRWLHEGLAQFIEFWYDSKNNPDRNQRAAWLIQEIRAGSIPTWSEMKERPMGGTDLPGYSWAWLKLEFLYRNFDNQRLPDMIRAIKGGKAEDEAMTESFKFAPDKLETGYQAWIKEQAKKGLNFHKQ
ncbi:MAG TPA: hypothetical protein VEJ63_02280 [Planctomycetota bacterium]|nr:hypothetical protein [Planctomycetota bacterium]